VRQYRTLHKDATSTARQREHRTGSQEEHVEEEVEAELLAEEKEVRDQSPNLRTNGVNAVGLQRKASRPGTCTESDSS
jgi:hypothetical protein